MRKPQWALFAAGSLFSVAGCSPPAADTHGHAQLIELEGEYAGQADGSWFMLCGSGRRYHVAGPAELELQQRHAAIGALPGQPVKALLTGYFGVLPDPGGQVPDSTVFAVRIIQLSDTLRCPPIPSSQISGRYEADLPGAENTDRHVVIDLFSNGDARMATDLRNGSPLIEDDGSWGTTSTDEVIMDWPRRGGRMKYKFMDGRLISDRVPPSGHALVFIRTSAEPERNEGAFGEVAGLARLAAGGSTTVEPLPGTPIIELFPDMAMRLRFFRSVQTAYDLPDYVVDREMRAATTLGDIVGIVRARKRKTG